MAVTILLEHGAVFKRVADNVSQLPVGVVDGVKDDGGEAVRVNVAARIQHAFLGVHVDDLAHQAARFRVIADQAALYGDTMPT